MNFFQRWTKPEKKAPAGTGPQSPEDQDPAEAEAETGSSGLANLLGRLEALAATGKMHEADALREYIARNHKATLKRMSAGMGKISGGLRSLAVQSAHGAAHLDPNVLGRILDRMDGLGDATLRQIEGRIGVTVSRDDRRQLQVLRDEMRKWLDARDAHLQEAQLAVDDLSAGAGELREELLKRSDRLTKAAEITAWVAHTPDSEALRHAMPEAAEFADSLRNLLAESRFTLDD